MIRLSDLSLSLQGKDILRSISADLPGGEVTAILGPNGAGKSSLLKCMTGSQKGYTGTVLLDGQDLRRYGLEDLASRRAVLSQHLQIAFPFSVEDVVQMGRNPFSKQGNPAKDQQVIARALEIVDAAPLRHRLFPTLSGGEQQRVQLARILAQLWETKDAYLFLDEPTSALDLKHQYHILSLISALSQQQGMTVIVILHDLNLARKFTNHSLLLKDGALLASGGSRDILRPDLVRDAYQVSMKEVQEAGSADCHLVFDESMQTEFQLN